MNQQNSVDANDLRSSLDNYCLKNLKNKATHNLGHSQDLVIDCVENSTAWSLIIEP